MADSHWLVADIGGTNARFALADPSRPGFSRARTYACVDFPSAYEAIDRYLADVCVDTLSLACVAAAGPVTGRVLNVTNNHWSFDADRLRSTYSLDVVELVNDFEAVAYALPHLGPSDLQSVGAAVTPTLDDGDFTVAAIGPGTGLGTAGLKRQRGRSMAIVAEAGHVGFAPRTVLQSELQRCLQATRHDLCSEHLVSGPGIERLYRGLAEVRGVDCQPRSAKQVFSAGLDDDDDLAAESVALFFELLGQAAGDLALTLGAWDAVYIAGGISTRYPDALRASGFREGFENKGDYRHLMEKIPTVLVTLEKPGLLGASWFAMARYHEAQDEIAKD